MKKNFLDKDEVLIYEDIITCSDIKGNLNLILTSKRLILKKETGMFKKMKEVIILLKDIKIYNDKVQVNQNKNNVDIQAIKNNISLSFSSSLKANKFVGKIIDVTTGTTKIKRGIKKINNVNSMIEEVTGINPKNTLKDFVEANKNVNNSLNNIESINGIIKTVNAFIDTAKKTKKK